MAEEGLSLMVPNVSYSIFFGAGVNGFVAVAYGGKAGGAFLGGGIDWF